MLTDKKITNSDKTSQGVVAAPDTLTGTPQQNKGIFDRLVSFFADKYNSLIDAFVATTGASEIGKTGGGTVQDHISSVLNPHSVNKAQVGLGNVDNTSDINKPISTAQQAVNNDTYRKPEVYTKSETNTQIDNKVVQIGAGDMAKAIYDTFNRNTDVFEYTYSKEETYSKQETYSKEETYSKLETYSQSETDNKFAEKLNSNLNLYVSPQGSNTLGDGTQGKPYKTINFALSTIPKILDNHTVIINLASGTYMEDVRVFGFAGGSILIKGSPDLANAVNYKINSLYISSGDNVGIYGISTTGSIYGRKILISNTKRIFIRYCNCTLTSTETGIDVISSMCTIFSTTISNTTDSAITSQGNSVVTVGLGTNGNNNVIGLSAGNNISGESGIICKGIISIGATTAEAKFYGGQIFA